MARDRAPTTQPYRLSPITLPEGGPRRRHVVPARKRLPESWDGYDDRTLSYDAVWKRDRAEIVLVCPKLLNFETLLRAAEFLADGARLGPPRFRHFRRYDEVRLACARPVARLEIAMDGLRLDCAVAPQATGFDGLDVVFTKSRDNRLDWIADWARHNVERQGATGICFIDNGSKDYPAEAVREVLAGIAGLRHFAVIEAPFLFGKIVARRGVHRAKFFQSAMHNVARHRFLHAAAGVASLDIDEIVVPLKGETMFEAARRAPHGYVTIPGRWRYARDWAGEAPKHSDHLWRADPDRPCYEKWCVVPESRMGRGSWDVHGVRRYWLNRVSRTPGQLMLHCDQLSTGWKWARQVARAGALVRDPLAEALWLEG